MKFKTGLWVSLLLLVLAGCASTNTPAPVTDRSPQSLGRAAPVEVKPGFYMIKKGDTLYSIALDHGQDHKDIVAWNNLDNPNLINVGQVIRVAPLGVASAAAVASTSSDGVESHPIAPPTQIESRPIDGKPLEVATSGVVGGLKREPKGGTQPYSDDAWAQAQKPQAPQATAAQTAMPVVMPPAQPSTPSASPQQAKPGEPTTKPIAEAASPATSHATAPATTDITWAWPTANKVTAPFNEGTNKGLDFNGAVGDPVLAAASGKVTLVTNSLRGYGNLIVIKHNTGYLSVYAHNSKMLVKEGQAVGKGQKIAEIGSTDSDRPNLHFEIRREGKPVDPAKFLPQR
jgi:lipoprotein NlpD